MGDLGAQNIPRIATSIARGPRLVQYGLRPKSGVEMARCWIGEPRFRPDGGGELSVCWWLSSKMLNPRRGEEVHPQSYGLVSLAPRILTFPVRTSTAVMEKEKNIHIGDSTERTPSETDSRNLEEAARDWTPAEERS